MERKTTLFSEHAVSDFGLLPVVWSNSSKDSNRSMIIYKFDGPAPVKQSICTIQKDPKSMVYTNLHEYHNPSCECEVNIQSSHGC